MDEWTQWNKWLHRSTKSGSQSSCRVKSPSLMYWLCLCFSQKPLLASWSSKSEEFIYFFREEISCWICIWHLFWSHFSLGETWKTVWEKRFLSAVDVPLLIQMAADTFSTPHTRLITVINIHLSGLTHSVHSFLCQNCHFASWDHILVSNLRFICSLDDRWKNLVCVTWNKSFYRNPSTDTRRGTSSSAGVWIRPVCWFRFIKHGLIEISSPVTWEEVVWLGNQVTCIYCSLSGWIHVSECVVQCFNYFFNTYSLRKGSVWCCEKLIILLLESRTFF